MGFSTKSYLFDFLVLDFFYPNLMVRGTGSGWDWVNFLHSRSYHVMFWVCDKNSVDNTSLWSLWVSCPGHAPPGSFAHSSLAEHGKLKSPWLKVSATWQQPKHLWVINVIFILNPKHCTVHGTVQKLTLPQLKPEQINTLQPLAHSLQGMW